MDTIPKVVKNELLVPIFTLCSSIVIFYADHVNFFGDVSVEGWC